MLLLLFLGLLIVIYLVSPKEAGRRVGGSRFDGLVISEVMAANNSAVPDENGEFHDWLELYNGRYIFYSMGNFCSRALPNTVSTFMYLPKR